MEWAEGYGKKSDLTAERASHDGPLERTWAWQLHHTYLQYWDASPVSPSEHVSQGRQSADSGLAFVDEFSIEEEANECRRLCPYQPTMGGNEGAAILQQNRKALHGGTDDDLPLRHATESVLSRLGESAKDAGPGIQEGLPQHGLHSADVADDAKFRATDSCHAEALFERDFDRYGITTGPSCKEDLERGFNLSVNRYASSPLGKVLSSGDESRIASSVNAIKNATDRFHFPAVHAPEAITMNNIGRTIIAPALFGIQAIQMFDANYNGPQLSLSMAENGKTDLQQTQPVALRTAIKKSPIKSLRQAPPAQTFRENGAGTEIDCLQGGNECVLPPEKPIQEREIKPGRKRCKQEEEVIIDLKQMLIQCAAQFQQSVSYTAKTMDFLINKLKRHISQHGHGRQRVAYYFVEALQARMSGRGGAMADSMRTNRAPVSLMIKAYRGYVSACPYIKLSHYFGNQTILDAAEGASRLHIVDFGILYGFQWPSLIYALGTKPSGPPLLIITGVDYHVNGDNSAEMLEDTGRRLADFASVCRVPFEYQAVTFMGENLNLNELNLREDEVVVVNCIHRLQHVMDEIAGSTARETVLKNIRSINPKIFVLVVVSASYNSPFFITRFKEALNHFSAIFDSLDNTMPKEDPDRFAIESKTLAHVIVGAVACEGAEMIERPEKHKQWQSRIIKAGFKQLPVSSNIKTRAYNMLRSYHAEFGIVEEGHWLLSVWKGYTINAFSVWCPD